MTISLPSWIDITALTIAIIFVLFSLKNGLLRSLLDVAVVIFSLYLAHLLYEQISASVSILSQSPLAYAAIIFSGWFSSFVILEMVLSVLLRLVNVSFAVPVDKAGSVIVGVIKVLIIGGLVFKLLLLIPLPGGAAKEIDNSYARRWFGNVFDWSYRQAEIVAGVKKYQFNAEPLSKGSKRKKTYRDPLIPDTQLKALEEALPKDLKLEDINLPLLELDKGSRKKR
jgi:hypothetical protein